MSTALTEAPEQAQKPGEARIAELRRIAALNGGILKPESVVEHAADPDSPLHSAFEWDDSEAAQQFRLEQARRLIRVTVNYLKVNGESRAVRVFVSLTPDREGEGGGYRETVAVMTNPSYRAQLIADARAEMQRFESKFSTLEELAEVFSAMKTARKKLR